MRPVLPLLLLLGVCSVGLAGTGCVPGGAGAPTLNPRLRIKPFQHTLPIRVGMLLPRDARPTAEHSPPPQPRISMAGMVYIFPYMFIVREGALLRDDSSIELLSSEEVAIARTTPVRALGDHALRVIRDTGAFQEVELVRRLNWTMDDLPEISRQSGYRYLLAMDVRHFFAMQHTENISDVQSNSQGQVTNREDHELSTASFESTVMRFRLFEVDGDKVRVFWQMSTRASRASDKKPWDVSGSKSAAECLRQLALGLYELTRSYAEHTQPAPAAQPESPSNQQ